MTIGLIGDPFERVDHENAGVSVGRAAHHVADELPVAGRVDDDDAAAAVVHPHPRRLDRDRLVALFLRRIDGERPLDREAAAFARGDDLFRLAVGETAGIVQQPSDKGGFTVVDVTCDRYAQVHYMYPPARRRSNEASLSLSIVRPARSGTRVARSSSMISSIVEALLSIGTVMFFSPSER